MQHGPSTGSSAPDDYEYDFQELRAQQERAKQLFHCYVDDDPEEEAEDYYAYYSDDELGL